MRKKEEVVELFQQMKKGNREAMDEIIDLFGQEVFNSAFTIVRDEQDAKDVSQEVFLNIWENREKLDIKHPRTYLSQAARYRALNLVDNRKKESDELKHYSASWHQDPVEAQPEHDGLPLDKERPLEEQLIEAISKLSKRQAHAFTEIALNGKTKEEVAESEKVTINTIRTHLHRAKKSLQQFIKKQS